MIQHFPISGHPHILVILWSGAIDKASAERLGELIRQHAERCEPRKIVGISVVAPNTKLPDRESRNWFDKQYESVEQHLACVYYVFFRGEGVVETLKSWSLSVANYVTANLAPKSAEVRYGKEDTVLQALKNACEDDTRRQRRALSNIRLAPDWDPASVANELEKAGLPLNQASANSPNRATIKKVA